VHLRSECHNSSTRSNFPIFGVNGVQERLISTLEMTHLEVKSPIWWVWLDRVRTLEDSAFDSEAVARVNLEDPGIWVSIHVERGVSEGDEWTYFHEFRHG